MTQSKSTVIGFAINAKMRWSEEDTLKFAILYKNQECLWNKYTMAYKNKAARQQAIESIVQQMKMEGFRVSEAKTKIKNLRSTYNQELLKIKKSQETAYSPAEVYVPNVKWFETFHWLMTTVKDGGGAKVVRKFIILFHVYVK